MIVEENNRFDQIRVAILEYLDDVMTKAKNENMARETGVQVQKAMRKFEYRDTEVTQELIYLVEKNYLKKTKVSTKSISSNKRFSTTYYEISGNGRDYLHGASQEFKSSRSFAGINITNIQGAIAIGENNVAIVHEPHLDLYNSLNSLKEAVLLSKEIDDEEKSEYVADIETIKSQVSKKQPNVEIVSAAWQAIQGLIAFEGVLQFIERIRPLIENLLK